ncbi:MAG TPA: hypothetical protein VFG34_09005 [Sphingopyxis sp.]|nr:hypothetical protein [Sphingopyxis sp.]
MTWHICLPHAELSAENWGNHADADDAGKIMVLRRFFATNS